jgi:glycosyltransferase involved in cell wall biosynthesis
VISAVMPTYNVAQYLPEAIDSVLAQTYTNWELIVVDDGSTDHTAAVLERYRDPRIRVFRLPRNAGRSHARNEAVRRARGRYVAICDSDDISVPDRFEVEVDFLERHPDVDVVSGRIECFPGPQMVFPDDGPEAIARRFARGHIGVAHGPCMIRASCFARHGLYCEDLASAEDFEFLHRIHRSSRFATIPKVLLRCRYELPPLAPGRWAQNALCHRYALYLARARARGTTVLPFAEYSRRWGPRIGVYTWDLLRFAHFHAQMRLRAQHVIR